MTDHGDRDPRTHTRRVGQRGDHRQMVQEGRRCCQRRRAAGRARDRQGDARGQRARRRRARRNHRQGRRDGRPRARCSARSARVAAAPIRSGKSDGQSKAVPTGAAHPPERRRKRRAASRAAAATNGGSQTRSAPTQMPPAPSAAKIAAERGIDTSAVAGSGKRGQVLKGDVLAFTPPSAPAQARPRRRRRARRRRPTMRRAKSACA